MHKLILAFSLLILYSCTNNTKSVDSNIGLIPNVLNYTGTPDSSSERSSLIFSDQGAWFAFGFSEDNRLGFSGPYLMTQDNGRWLSSSLFQLNLVEEASNAIIEIDKSANKSYLSHLERASSSRDLKIYQTLVFDDAQRVIIENKLVNQSTDQVNLNASFSGDILLDGIQFEEIPEGLQYLSERSKAKGRILTSHGNSCAITDSLLTINLKRIELRPQDSISIYLVHELGFEEQKNSTLSSNYNNLKQRFHRTLEARKKEKLKWINDVQSNLSKKWDAPISNLLIQKALLTLQNNWRSPAGELLHSGLFPSYHYKWFHGFWAWDSWKHAAALAYFNEDLAKNQIRAMFDFMDEKGFIADCVYRDTTIERHNFRNTKPPLSAWAIWKVFTQSQDTAFIDEMYPKVKLQHHWWYNNRDHNSNGLCEYGSTDGSLIAAKWESGMDNGVRFDDSQILQNSSSAFSLNQESIDLNSFLCFEKFLLSKMANILNKDEESSLYLESGNELKRTIQNNFYDPDSGWFYDKKINSDSLIRVKGSEGWSALWTNIATSDQASQMMKNMMDSTQFFTKIPFQTMSADHPKFKPNRGYWRGPNWLDQAYFGIGGLKKYNYENEAYQATQRIIENAQGLNILGPSIRENYNPITGEGIEAHNFSWSAACLLLMLMDEND